MENMHSNIQSLYTRITTAESKGDDQILGTSSLPRAPPTIADFGREFRLLLKGYLSKPERLIEEEQQQNQPQIQEVNEVNRSLDNTNDSSINHPLNFLINQDYCQSIMPMSVVHLPPNSHD